MTGHVREEIRRPHLRRRAMRKGEVEARDRSIMMGWCGTVHMADRRKGRAHQEYGEKEAGRLKKFFRT